MAIKTIKDSAFNNSLDIETNPSYLLGTNPTGNTVRIEKSSLGLDLGNYNGNVFIMFHKYADGKPVLLRVEDAKPLLSSVELVSGVVVIQGNYHLAISVDEFTSKWSTSNVAGGAVTTTAWDAAMRDFAGRENTNKLLTHVECNNGNVAAAGKCNNYAKAMSTGGIGATKWWLPSLGELLFMFSNARAINYALSFIPNATPLQMNDSEGNPYYWSSTEYNTNTAWSMSMINAHVDISAQKSNSMFRVRPVSSFMR